MYTKENMSRNLRLINQALELKYLVHNFTYYNCKKNVDYKTTWVVKTVLTMIKFSELYSADHQAML